MKGGRLWVPKCRSGVRVECRSLCHFHHISVFISDLCPSVILSTFLSSFAGGRLRSILLALLPGTSPHPSKLAHAQASYVVSNLPVAPAVAVSPISSSQKVLMVHGGTGVRQ